ncbi:MAG: hypothetical protein MZV63_07965 [Marinilabiliales bacterium]|nr:hypothetical protein [Marinilabiliales bacterium]
MTTREGYLSVTLGWLVLVLSGTLPYLYSGEIKGLVNMIFESVSGYTTTGASILTNVEILPKSVLFWRSLTHWIGGIGIILLVIIILPSLKVGGYNLFSLESSLKQKILPRTKSVAMAVLMIYMVLTIAEIILLTAGGMDLFDSICHSFGTIATGGFLHKEHQHFRIFGIISSMCLLYSCSSRQQAIVVFYFILKRNFTRVKANEELWFYIFFTTACGGMCHPDTLFQAPAGRLRRHSGIRSSRSYQPSPPLALPPPITPSGHRLPMY